MILVPAERIARYTERGWWGRRRIHDWLDEAAAAAPDRLALTDPPNREQLTGGEAKRLSWREVREQSTAWSARLLQAGLRKDDVVVVQLPNCVELPLVYLACMRLGIVVTPVPVQYREHELEHILQLTHPRAAITAERILKHRHADMFRALGVWFPGMAEVLTIDRPAFEEAAAKTDVESAEKAHPVSSNDVVTICWTSGTEGVPKGVPRSHNEWLPFPENIVLSGGLQPGCHLLNAFPMVNIAGIAGQLLPWLMTGGRLSMHHPFDLDLFLAQLREEEVNYTVSSPAVWAMLAQNPQLMEGIAERVRVVGSASGPLAEWVIRAFSERWGIDIVNYYGTNEGCSITASALDLPDPALRAKFFPRFGVDGFEWKLPAARRIRTRLVDPDTGQDIDEPGRPGELRAIGPGVFSGYWKSPELTARAFDEQGYYRSGDLFEIAGERNELYRFVGRLKDIVVRGGFNISSEEVEALILSHPKVREAAVIGYPDETLGERVCAAVALAAGETLSLDELVQFLREEKRVASFKLPERLLVLDSLPRNPVGKLLKRELRRLVGEGSLSLAA